MRLSLVPGEPWHGAEAGQDQQKQREHGEFASAKIVGMNIIAVRPEK